MVILKIKDRGLFIDIPGASPTRSPAEIDISKCNLTQIDVYLRKMGVKEYEIISRKKEKIKIKKNVTRTPKNHKSRNPKKDPNNDRIDRLEKMMEALLEKSLADNPTNSEQITNKLDKLEKLTQKIAEKETTVVEKSIEPPIKKAKLKTKSKDSTFVPKIDTSGMKIKSTSKQKVKQELDVDDNVDLLSRIMGNE
jgi:hypothetical protein